MSQAPHASAAPSADPSIPVVDYLAHPDIAARLAKAPSYVKLAKTLLRLPVAEELGQTMATIVLGVDGLRPEAKDTITPEVVIARNPGPIGSDAAGQPIFNEWLIPRETVARNYGQAVLDGLTHEFCAHRKIDTVRAIELDEQVLSTLGVKGDQLAIDVWWSPEPMVARRGDFLTDDGESISAHDMARTYVRQDQLARLPSASFLDTLASPVLAVKPSTAPSA